MDSLKSRCPRHTRASFPRVLMMALMSVSLVCATPLRATRAEPEKVTCDKEVFYPEQPWGACTCPQQKQMSTGASCEQPTISFVKEHWGCKTDIPRTMHGTFGCKTKPAQIRQEMKCYVGVDMWNMAYCAGGSVGCTGLLIVVGGACIPEPLVGVTCPAAIAAFAGCKVAWAGSCLAPCYMSKCYTNRGSLRKLDENVFSHFTGGRCIGTAPYEPTLGDGG